ncbi:MAG: MOSC N-terminal beta barrel domain-containing protein [Bacteroidota bacterium]
MSSILVKQLFLFPIKSLAGISVDQVAVDPAGFVGDRRFMLVDPQGKFITQRTRPELTRFELSLMPGGYLVHDRISGNIKVLVARPALKDSLAAELWEDNLQVIEAGEGWSEWFSDLLKEPVRLVMQQEDSPRIIKEIYQTQGSKQSSFADSLPILLASEASYANVEAVYGQSFDPLRFRANMIVSGSGPFEEDTWEEISIHSVRMFGAKPCARCQLVNVEPSSGAVDAGGVLKALATFRQKDHKVYFGQQMVPISLGMIKIGDELKVIKRKDALF